MGWEEELKEAEMGLEEILKEVEIKGLVERKNQALLLSGLKLDLF